jgi:hypothetical protein
MLIALLSTLISSIALVGVAVSLLLQARQLRTSQLQATRAAQLELIKMTIDNPTLATTVLGEDDPEVSIEDIFINWHFQYLQFAYENGSIPMPSLPYHMASLFKAEAVRNWWGWARRSYEMDATTRREKQFFAIADQEFQRASRMPEPPENAPTSSAGPVIPPPPS